MDYNKSKRSHWSEKQWSNWVNANIGGNLLWKGDRVQICHIYTTINNAKLRRKQVIFDFPV